MVIQANMVIRVKRFDELRVDLYITIYMVTQSYALCALKLSSDKVVRYMFYSHVRLRIFNIAFVWHIFTNAKM